MFVAPVGVLSKIRGPSAAGLLPRARVLARLEQLRRSARCVWVGAPAGSGKTALLASYLERHPAPVVWCQLDQDDGEPARLFHYLGLAGLLLPEVQPSHLDDFPVYAQHLFARMFGPGTERGVLVLDSYQAVGDDRAFHLLIRMLLAALPGHVDAFILSRFGPPPEFARLLSAGQLAELDWEQLRLAADETCAIVAQRCRQLALPPSRAHAAFAQRLHERTGGWVAGLVMILAQPGAVSGLDLFADAQETLFAYFAEEIFAPCSPELRTFLLHTAVLPSFTLEMAQAMSGNPFAAGFLNRSLRQFCFIERRESQGARTVYRYHLLFREFLLARLRIGCSEREVRALRQRALGLLEDDGDCEGSAELLMALADPEAVAAFALEHAASLLERGSQATLGALLTSLPPAAVGADGRLLYWQAVCQAGAGARRGFERALALLEARGDAPLCALAWSGIVESIHAEGRDVAVFGHWLDVLERLRERFPQLDRTELATPVLASVLIAITACPERSARPAAWMQQALARIVSADANARAVLLARLCVLYVRAGDVAGVRMALAELRGLGERPQLRDAVRVDSLLAQAMGHWLLGEGQRARPVAEQAAALVESAGLDVGRHAALNLAMAAALADNDLAAAEHYRRRINAVIDGVRPVDQAAYRYQLACLALQRGQAADADRLFELAAIQLRSVGDRFGLACALADRAYAAHLLGDATRAGALCEQAIALSASTGSQLARYKCLLVRAALEHGRDGMALPLLAEAMALGRSCAIENFPGWNRDMMALLSSLALALDVEPVFVAQLVQSRGLRIPSARPTAWPWPLMLRTLGQFEVLRGGAPLVQAGKGNRRSLDLLKAIIAFGGRGVAIENVTAALWPDAEGDSAKGAFDVAMHRLRKLIGRDHVLIVSNGKVSLNDEVCWLDIWVFQEQAQQVLDCSTAQSADMDTIAVAASGMLETYRGRFLASEMEQSWLLPMRDRLRRLLARAADRAGARLHAGKQTAAATALRQNAREADRA
jgi:LuxR family maltose regulon positive regulatory protein